MGKDLEGSVRRLIEILFQNLPGGGGAEEIFGKPLSHDSGTRRDAKPTPHEYKP
jgi:hypothetical protein